MGSQFATGYCSKENKKPSISFHSSMHSCAVIIEQVQIALVHRNAEAESYAFLGRIGKKENLVEMGEPA